MIWGGGGLKDRNIHRKEIEKDIYIYIKIESWKQKGKEIFYLTIKAKFQNKITGLVHTGHCVVVGERKWKVISEIRYENMEDYDHVGVYVFILLTQIRHIGFSWWN